MAEKGYMFLLGLFLKIWGLKRLKLDNSLEIGSKIGTRIRMYRGRDPAAPEDPPPFCKVGWVLVLENVNTCNWFVIQFLL
jgi:hypothetical protein